MHTRKLQQKLLDVLVAVLRKWADAAERKRQWLDTGFRSDSHPSITQGTISPVPSPSSDAASMHGGGPPVHWLEYIRRRAPRLLSTIGPGTSQATESLPEPQLSSITPKASMDTKHVTTSLLNDSPLPDAKRDSSTAKDPHLPKKGRDRRSDPQTREPAAFYDQTANEIKETQASPASPTTPRQPVTAFETFVTVPREKPEEAVPSPIERKKRSASGVKPMKGDLMDSSTGSSLMQTEPNLELRSNHGRNSVVYLDFPPPPAIASSNAAGGGDKQLLGKGKSLIHEFILESSDRAPADAQATHMMPKTTDGPNPPHSVWPSEFNPNQFLDLENGRAGPSLNRPETPLHLDAKVHDNKGDLSDRSVICASEDRWPDLPPMPETSQAFPDPALRERLLLDWNRRRERDREQEGQPWSV